MTTEEKEQALLIEAEKTISKQRFNSLDDSMNAYIDIYIEGAKSNAAKQYHSEPPMDLGELKGVYVNTFGKDVDFSGEHGDFNPKLMYDIFNFFAPHLKPGKSEWISVCDKLPENEQEILFTNLDIKDDSGKPYEPTTFGGWYRKGFVYTWLGEFEKPKERQLFTHWMPIPEPPKK